jgi:hypothetical protein
MLLKKVDIITTLIAYPSASGVVALDSITAIGNSAFYDCKSLTGVSFPAAASIGDSAFYGCTSLATATLKAASSVGDSAFYGCTSLVTANVRAASSIGNHAFRGCTSLATVELTAAVTIGSAAFYQCIALTEVDLPAATSIGEYAFSTCRLLAAVNLPAVETIGSYVFEDCKSLAKLILPTTPPTVGSNTFNAIEKAQTVTVKVFSAYITAYDSAWRTAFKGGNAYINLIVQAQYDDPVVDVILWANEDGDIHSTTDVTISKTASGNPASFTVTVAGAYTVTQWQVNSVPLSSAENPLTIAAADYLAGKTYILGVEVTKNGVPYSTNIRFTVEE